MIDIYFLICPLNAKRQHLFSKSLTSQVIIVNNVIFLKRKTMSFWTSQLLNIGLLNIVFSHQWKYDSVISQGVKSTFGAFKEVSTGANKKRLAYFICYCTIYFKERLSQKYFLK